MSLEEALNNLAEAVKEQTKTIVQYSSTGNGAAAPSVEAAAEPAADEPEAAEEKPKVAPKKKKVAPKAAKKPEDNPDYMRMAESLNALAGAKRSGEVVAILAEYDVKRATEAPEDKWGEIADKFEAAIAGEAEEETEEGLI